MKYLGKATKIGDSFFVIIPSNIKNSLKIEKGDMLNVDVEVGSPENIERIILKSLKTCKEEDLPTDNYITHLLNLFEEEK
jgi:bifunctional DNA-binding transcriptional regulator/antitoxin component of YhaV-PrlF toxin-antitoxin module